MREIRETLENLYKRESELRKSIRDLENEVGKKKAELDNNILIEIKNKRLEFLRKLVSESKKHLYSPYEEYEKFKLDNDVSLIDLKEGAFGIYLRDSFLLRDSDDINFIIVTGDTIRCYKEYDVRNILECQKDDAYNDNYLREKRVDDVRFNCENCSLEGYLSYIDIDDLDKDEILSEEDGEWLDNESIYDYDRFEVLYTNILEVKEKDTAFKFIEEIIL